VQRRVDHEAAAGDDDHVVNRLGDLGQDVAGEQDRAPLSGEPAQEVAQPADAFGVEPVRWLIEDEDPRVADQRAREAEPLAHSEREPAGTPVGGAVEFDEPEELVDAGRRDAGFGGEHAQMARRALRAGWAVASSMAPTTRSGAASVAYGLPSMVALPAVGVTSPSSERSVVVLPEPLGPRKPVTVPLWTANVRSSTA
jgi:hypothetical protein